MLFQGITVEHCITSSNPDRKLGGDGAISGVVTGETEADSRRSPFNFKIS